MRLPCRSCISRHNGCPLFRTPRARDGRHVPAGLLAHSSNACLLPSRLGLNEARPVALSGESLPLTVAGAAPVLDRLRSAPCSHFHQYRSNCTGTVTGPKDQIMQPTSSAAKKGVAQKHIQPPESAARSSNRAGPRHNQSPLATIDNPATVATIHCPTRGGNIAARPGFVISILDMPKCSISLSCLQRTPRNRCFADRQMHQRRKDAKRHRDPPHHIIRLGCIEHQSCRPRAQKRSDLMR